MAADPNTITAKVAELFDRESADSVELFCPGGFNNLGYWKGINVRGGPTVADRVQSEKSLYRKVLATLEIGTSDRLLEIACGRGRGAALALTEFGPAEVHGVDLATKQIERALESNADTLANSGGRLVYRQGSATALPYADSYFDNVLSVEATQRFPDIDKFLAEMFRVLRKPAKMAIASVFSTKPGVAITEFIPDDLLFSHPITELTAKLIDNGFANVNISSLGEDVWRGWDSWLRETAPKWRRDWNWKETQNWLEGFEQGAFDYYLVTATAQP